MSSFMVIRHVKSIHEVTGGHDVLLKCFRLEYLFIKRFNLSTRTDTHTAKVLLTVVFHTVKQLHIYGLLKLFALIVLFLNVS